MDDWAFPLENSAFCLASETFDFRALSDSLTSRGCNIDGVFDPLHGFNLGDVMENHCPTGSSSFLQGDCSSETQIPWWDKPMSICPSSDTKTASMSSVSEGSVLTSFEKSLGSVDMYSGLRKKDEIHSTGIINSYSVDELAQLLATSPQSSNDSLHHVAGNNDLFDAVGLGTTVPGIDSAQKKCGRKGLFAELLSSFSSSSCVSQDSGSSSKRRKTEISYSSDLKPLPSPFLPGWEMFSNGFVATAGESVNVRGDGASPKPRIAEEQAKVSKKRAKPGESNRPRPKDRQMIQDRIKELRKIIPSGAKCSIDALLDRTIKHMLFLQGVEKHAEKLRRSGQAKLTYQREEGLSMDEGASYATGATWACQVGDQSMSCPIIVEDLSPTGTMLIEMLCDDRGFFLEIADIIKGLGLNILKGVMEVRGSKIWAHFIVETKRRITRLEVFWSLVKLLQQTDGTNIVDSTGQEFGFQERHSVAAVRLSESSQ